MDCNVELGTEVIQNPDKTLRFLDSACVRIQERIKQDMDNPGFTIKRKIHARIKGIIAADEFLKTKVPRTEDNGKLIAFAGTVVRTGMMKMVETQKVFNCAKCNAIVTKLYDRTQYNIVEKPTSCPGDSQESCNSTKFVESQPSNYGVDNCKDYQEIRVQEQVSKLQIGNVPRSITVILEDDLIDSCKPGDNVLINATVFQRWKRLRENDRCDVQICLYANYVELINDEMQAGSQLLDFENEFQRHWEKYADNPMVGRNVLLESFCPQIHGMYLVKLAVMLILIGGVAKEDNGTSIRGDSHLLLVGDPGT
jgi:DNA helicase MCM9